MPQSTNFNHISLLCPIARNQLSRTEKETSMSDGWDRMQILISLIEEYVENIQYCRTFILDGVAATLSSGTSYEPGVKKNGAMVY